MHSLANNSASNRPNPAGFTLIELLITVVVIAILAAIAVPSYTQYVIDSRRSAVQSFMMDVATKEQQFLLDARAYTNNLTTLGLGVPGDITPFYTVTVATPSASEFTITATPVVGSSQAGDGNLTLNHTGAKAPANKWTR